MGRLWQEDLQGRRPGFVASDLLKVDPLLGAARQWRRDADDSLLPGSPWKMLAAAQPSPPVG
jgi:hypothetical protein